MKLQVYLVNTNIFLSSCGVVASLETACVHLTQVDWCSWHSAYAPVRMLSLLLFQAFWVCCMFIFTNQNQEIGKRSCICFEMQMDYKSGYFRAPKTSKCWLPTLGILVSSHLWDFGSLYTKRTAHMHAQEVTSDSSYARESYWGFLKWAVSI